MKNYGSLSFYRLGLFLCGCGGLVTLPVDTVAQAPVAVEIVNAADIYQPLVTALDSLPAMQNQIQLAVGQIDGMAAAAQGMNIAFGQHILDYEGNLDDMLATMNAINLNLSAAVDQMSVNPLVAAINGWGAQNTAVLQSIDANLVDVAGNLAAMQTTVSGGLAEIAGNLTNLTVLTNINNLTNLAGLTNFGTVSTNFLAASFDLSNVVTRLDEILQGSNYVTISNQVMLTNVFTNAIVGADVLTNDISAMRQDVADMKAAQEAWKTSSWKDTNYWTGFQGMVDNSGLGSLGANVEANIGVWGAAMDTGDPDDLEIEVEGYTWSLRPSSVPGWAPVASGIHAFCTWSIVLGFFWFLFRELKEAVFNMGAIQQMRFPKLTVAGFSVGWVVISIYVVGALLLLGAIPAFVLNVYSGGWLSGFEWSAVLVNPFNMLTSVNPSAAAMMGEVLQFFPLALAMSAAGAVFAARTVITGAFQLANLTFRAMPA